MNDLMVDRNNLGNVEPDNIIISETIPAQKVIGILYEENKEN